MWASTQLSRGLGSRHQMSLALHTRSSAAGLPRRRSAIGRDEITQFRDMTSVTGECVRVRHDLSIMFRIRKPSDAGGPTTHNKRLDACRDTIENVDSSSDVIGPKNRRGHRVPQSKLSLSCWSKLHLKYNRVLGWYPPVQFRQGLFRVRLYPHKIYSFKWICAVLTSNLYS